MKNLTSMLFLLTLIFATTNTIAAVKIVECEDEEGNRSFQKACPPGSTQIGAKKLNTGVPAGSKKSNADIQATLYMIPDCEACDEIRDFLGSRNISITEKNVNETIELQTELTELTGSLKVPTTVIADEIITGYSRSKFLSALEAAGYSDEDS